MDVRVRRILERCLYGRAESFANAVLSGTMTGFALDHVRDIVLSDLNSSPAPKGAREGTLTYWLAALSVKS